MDWLQPQEGFYHCPTEARNELASQTIAFVLYASGVAYDRTIAPTSEYDQGKKKVNTTTDLICMDQHE